MTERFAHPGTPFPIGIEYYRGGAPRPEFWDEDFANIRAAGFRIVRSASYWNWMEPARDAYHLDDYDAMFDLAAKHGLSMWLDVMLATHGAAPEWMTRDYPDFRVVNYRGQTPLAVVRRGRGNLEAAPVTEALLLALGAAEHPGR